MEKQCSAVDLIKTAMSKTRSKLAAISSTKLNAITPQESAEMIAKLRRQNSMTTQSDSGRQGSFHKRFLAQKDPIISRVQQVRAISYWIENASHSLKNSREYSVSSLTGYVSIEGIQESDTE